jgi:predicted PurR-regulated permease PerM
MAVIFVGAIGGFLSSGIIGLFVGAVVLVLGYKLFLAWLYQTHEVQAPASQRMEETLS